MIRMAGCNTNVTIIGNQFPNYYPSKCYAKTIENMFCRAIRTAKKPSNMCFAGPCGHSTKKMITEFRRRIYFLVDSTKPALGRFRTFVERFGPFSNGFGRFRTVFEPFRTVSDRCRPFLDRFRPVFGPFWTVSDDLGALSDCFRTTPFLI